MRLVETDHGFEGTLGVEQVYGRCGGGAAEMHGWGTGIEERCLLNRDEDSLMLGGDFEAFWDREGIARYRVRVGEGVHGRCSKLQVRSQHARSSKTRSASHCTLDQH